MRLILAVLAFVIGVRVAAALAGSSRWNQATAVAASTLSTTAAREAYREDSLGGLPAPVQRYFKRVLRDGQPFVRGAVATQEAEFFINGAWRPLTATQDFVTTPPGFVWDARIKMAPLLSASVRDAYINGSGAMQASIYGVYSLADQTDKPELNSGALQRYLGESVWFPTALLPSAAVSWAAKDDRSAVVRLQDNGITVALVFEFGGDGMVTTISGDRYKEANGSYTLQPWRIACDDATPQSGMLIPARCEVPWISDGTDQPYWRGRIRSITYRYD